MLSLKNKIEKLKRVHYIVTGFLFVATLFFCSYTATDLKLINTSLSHFGIYNNIGILWNASVFLIGITLFIEAYLNIKKYSHANWLLFLFAVSILCLLLTATINMKHAIHFYTAYIYFIGFTICMFLFGFLLIKTDFRIGITSIVISLLSLIGPVGILMYLGSFAIPELTHTLFVFIWMIIIRFENNYKKFLKKLRLNSEPEKLREQIDSFPEFVQESSF